MAPDDDVPSGIDLRNPIDVAEWVAAADVKRPWRADLRRAIALLLPRRPLRVLELGAGPGLLAEEILRSCEIAGYTLFDFSPPMLALARHRIGDRAGVQWVLGDFKQPGWTAALARPYDAVVAMQSVHEIRHKRHVPQLYAEVRDVLAPSGVLVVCDHEPLDDTPRAIALLATVAEQHAALASAGFEQITTHVELHGMYVCSGTTRQFEARLREL